MLQGVRTSNVGFPCVIPVFAFPIVPASSGYISGHSLLILCLFLAACSIVLMARCWVLRRNMELLHRQKLFTLRRQLDKNALRYKNLLEDAGDAIFVINTETGFLEEVNRRGSELLGYSKEELGSVKTRDLIVPQDQKKFTSLVRRVKERGMATSGSITFKRRDGSSFLGEINARLIELDDGRVVQAIIRDITYKSKTEKEIKQRNRELTILNNLIARANQNLQLQTVLDVTLGEVLDVFGAEGGGIHLQDHTARKLRLAARHNLSDSLVAHLEESDLETGIFGNISSIAQFYVVSDLQQSKDAMAKAAGNDGWRTFAGVPLFAKDQLVGIMHVLMLHDCQFSNDEVKLFTTIGNQIGNIIEHARLFEELNWKTEELMRSHRLLEKSSHRLALSQDRLKQNLELVEKANIELEHLDRMKTHFLGMISHEFKTPLTTIMGGSEFLMASAGPFQDEELKIIEMIHKGGARLNEIVNDLLKLAKLETKAPVLSKAPLSLAELFDILLVQFRPLLDERKIAVELDNIHRMPPFNADREYLEEIFSELLENAIKFTPDGKGVRVAARIIGRQAIEAKRSLVYRFHPGFLEQVYETNYLEVEVRDQGIGIDFQDQIRVFEKFFEVGDICNHSTGKHKFQGKGAGLGLAIVKGMVEAHGGMVWVESPGMDIYSNPGSSFFVLIPLEEGPRQPAFSFMEPELHYLVTEQHT